MADKITTKMKFQVGILFCSQVRDFLNRCKFEGLDIDFFESNGIISREFIIKGDSKDIIRVKNLLEPYFD